jgi:hypothetical protein
MVMAKALGLDKKQAMSFLHKFLDHFQSLCNQQRPVNAADLEKYISRNFRNVCNGKPIGKSLTDFAHRIGDLQKKHSSTKIHVDSNQDFFVNDNKAVIQFVVDLVRRDGEKEHLFVMAVATVEDNLITEWNQVSHVQSV